MVKSEKYTIREIIDYIDNAFSRGHKCSIWITEQGEKINTDVGYGGEWWEDCMKPELLRVFEKGADRSGNT